MFRVFVFAFVLNGALCVPLSFKGYLAHLIKLYNKTTIPNTLHLTVRISRSSEFLCLCSFLMEFFVNHYHLHLMKSK